MNRERLRIALDRVKHAEAAYAKDTNPHVGNWWTQTRLDLAKVCEEELPSMLALNHTMLEAAGQLWWDHHCRINDEKPGYVTKDGKEIYVGELAWWLMRAIRYGVGCKGSTPQHNAFDGLLKMALTGAREHCAGDQQ